MPFPITADRIAELLGVSRANVEKHWPLIEQCLDSLGVGDEAVCIAALATIRVECPPFKPIREYGSDNLHEKNYGGRADLGNNQPGDGARYAGRGFIQITGKNNYKHYGNLLGADLVTNPDAALEPNTAAAIFAAYFHERHVADAAHAGDWKKVRRLVNGGYNGLEDFLRYVTLLQSEIARHDNQPA